MTKHPLVRYGHKRGWLHKRTAKYFDVPYPSFRMIVTGWANTAPERAQRWSKRSRGEFTAATVLRWQKRNGK